MNIVCKLLLIYKQMYHMIDKFILYLFPLFYNIILF